MPLTFACGRCGQKYQVQEALAGKKVKCKGCGEVIHIPGPGPSRPPAAGRKAATREELVPSWIDEADEEESDVPAPVSDPRRTSGPRAHPSAGKFHVQSRPSGLDPATVKYLAIGGAAIVGVIVIAVAWIALSGGSRGSRAAVAAHEQVIEEGLTALDELSSIFAGIEDQDSARSRAPRAELAARALVDLAGRAARLPKLSADEEQRLANKYRPQTNASLRKWTQALDHVKALPGVPGALQGVVDQLATFGA